MKMTNVLVVAGILCIGNMLMGEDKILFDGQAPAWSSTEIKVDPENPNNKALLWVGAVKGSALYTTPTEKDWSKYTALSFRIYVAEADGHEIMVVCESNPEGTQGNYYFKRIKIDWKGWKSINIPFSEFGISRNVIGWNTITLFYIGNNGWGCLPNPKAEYYIDDVKLLEGTAKINSL
jgi:hypothetical protein